MNGLGEHFGPQCSQLLMLNPLASVETACAVIQQEESQRNILQVSDIGRSAIKLCVMFWINLKKLVLIVQTIMEEDILVINVGKLLVI